VFQIPNPQIDVRLLADLTGLVRTDWTFGVVAGVQMYENVSKTSKMRGKQFFQFFDFTVSLG
jgi:hypothetical protein